MSPADRSRLPPIGPDPRFAFPTIEKERLPNGLAVWMTARPGLPVVTFTLLIQAGSAADPGDAHGLASITGDMLDEGSGDRTAIQMHEELERIGARFETEVGADSTVLALTTLSRYVTRGLSLLFDMAARPCFGPGDFERVRQLRLNRLKQVRDLPSAVADRSFLRLVYGATHPYGHAPLGTTESVERLTLDQATHFHRARYAPADSTLIVAGDFEDAALGRALGDTFGAWKTASDRSEGHGMPPLTVDRNVEAGLVALVDRPGAQQSEIRLGHAAASRNTPDYHALLVLNMALGGQFVSRLNMNLRESKGYTYGVRTAFDFRRGRGPFVLQTSVQTSVTAAAITEARAEICAIRRERPITENELTLARSALTRGYPRGFETAEQIARAASQLALYDLPDDYFEQFVPRISAVQASDVTRAASTYLDPDAMTTVVVGDVAQVERSMVESGVGEPQLIDAM